MRNRLASRTDVAGRRPIAFHKALQRTKNVAWIGHHRDVPLLAQFLRPRRSAATPLRARVRPEHGAALPHGDMVMVLRRSGYHVGDVIAYRVPKGDLMAGPR
jgi:hypothetical protein